MIEVTKSNVGNFSNRPVFFFVSQGMNNTSKGDKINILRLLHRRFKMPPICISSYLASMLCRGKFMTFCGRFCSFLRRTTHIFPPQKHTVVVIKQPTASNQT